MRFGSRSSAPVGLSLRLYFQGKDRGTGGGLGSKAETSAAGLRGCFQGAVHPMVLKRPTPLRHLREAASALQPPLRIRPKLQDASTLVQQPSWIVACFYCSNHRGFHPEARGRRSLPEKGREGLCLVQSQAVRERWAKLAIRAVPTLLPAKQQRKTPGIPPAHLSQSEYALL